jgi:hypothetical protein
MNARKHMQIFEYLHCKKIVRIMHKKRVRNINEHKKSSMVQSVGNKGFDGNLQGLVKVVK